MVVLVLPASCRDTSLIGTGIVSAKLMDIRMTELGITRFTGSSTGPNITALET